MATAEEKQAIREAAAALGRKGGQKTFKKHGASHMKKLAIKRWGKKTR